MTKLILRLYEIMRAKPTLRWMTLFILTLVMVLLFMKQTYKEDISDFLPLNSQQQQTLQDYQNTVSARRIYIIFQNSDKTHQDASDLFYEILDRVDTAQITDCMASDNPDMMRDAMNVVYGHIPYLLTPEDYQRIDSLLGNPDYIAQQLEHDKQMLMLPTAGLLTEQIQHDPLNLFTPVLKRLKTTSNRTILMIDSPYGASETEHNTQLMTMLQQVCDSVLQRFPATVIHLTGGPVIAVGNARQIKSDSMLSITLAIVLITLLLWMAFRNVHHIMLIALSIGWGWLFAMGILTLVHNNVSIIVIGISSVILGIAVNYPLHLIAHLSHSENIRSALKEIVMPLVVGNITTVGAFLTLVPLESVALRDLGLFSAFLLIGTILFVLIWLPHMVRGTSKVTHSIFDRIGDVQLENKPWFVWIVVVLTFVLGYFSLQTSFDADLRNINYMNDEQKQDMEIIQQFMPSVKENNKEHLERWNAWCSRNSSVLCKQLREKGVLAGFSSDSFADFYHLLNISQAEEGQSLTSTIVSNLSDNFNYIGWACGFIVFFFLWFSLGNIELALLSFLPMAVSWVWILGIMSLLGIQFNVVNIILATFIFGQGDDYTIFMTEGCQYEYAYRRKMLNSYKHSIIISALIMFIGIGALIIAKHPALQSLAQVTIVGMFTVVLMAWLLPSFIFRWLVFNKDGFERKQPITLRNLLFIRSTSDFQFVSNRYRYRGVEISTSVDRRLRYWRKHITELEQLSKEKFLIDEGWGETAMLIAIRNPQQQYVVKFADDERAIVASHAIDGIVNNIRVDI